jgi:hypothetical protein
MLNATSSGKRERTALVQQFDENKDEKEETEPNDDRSSTTTMVPLS